MFTSALAVPDVVEQGFNLPAAAPALASPWRHHVHIRLKGFQAGSPEVRDRLRFGTALRPALLQPTAPAAAAPTLFDVGVAGPDLVATGQAATSPLLSGAWVLFHRLQAMFDHEDGGGFVLRPLSKCGFLPGAPLAPGMTTPDIGVPRCHYPIAGQAPTPPGRLRVRVRLDWLNPGSPHDGGDGFMI
jgi:hypothetical protein